MVDKQAAARAIEEFLRAIGRDPGADPELAQTGARVADAYAELCSGYSVDVAALLDENVIEQSAGVVVLRDIATTTMCPHHLMPATGTAIVAYEPSARILGVGAIARVVDAFSRRLTLQEQVGEQVAEALFSRLAPRWAVCRLSMLHTCMSARGERRHGARLVTFAVRGDREAAMRAMGPLG
jgi:GTP cyclohydrolase IA